MELGGVFTVVDEPEPVFIVPHVPPVSLTKVRPLGMTSVNATLCRTAPAMVLGLVTVIVSVELPPAVMGFGLKDLVMVGAWIGVSTPHTLLVSAAFTPTTVSQIVPELGLSAVF